MQRKCVKIIVLRCSSDNQNCKDIFRITSTHLWRVSALLILFKYIFDESYRRPKSMINLLYSCLITSSDRFIKINSLCTINTVQSFQEYVVTILVVLIYTHRTEEYDDIIGSYFLHHTIGNRYSLRLKKKVNEWVVLLSYYKIWDQPTKNISVKIRKNQVLSITF